MVNSSFYFKNNQKLNKISWTYKNIFLCKKMDINTYYKYKRKKVV